MSSARPLSSRARYFGPQPISQLMQLALSRPELISLAAGFIDAQSLPVAETSQAVTAVLAEDKAARAALQYGSTAGLPALREAILARFLAVEQKQPASPPDIRQVVLTAGSNQMLHLIGEVLLDPGDIVLCAAPCYLVFLGILDSLGARSLGVAIDDEGIVPESLEEELAHRDRAGELERVKAIYLTSYFDNPSTVTLSLARRRQIVEIAQRWSRQAPIYVIDDTAYRELRYDCDDLPSLRSFDDEGDTVIVADTFSKSFSPGIRVGWGILPPALVEPVCGLKGHIDFGSPNFNQYVMAEVLRQGLLESHLQIIRKAYREKRQAMLAAMDAHLAGISGVSWTTPRGGLYVWLHLPDGMDAGPEGVLLDHALDEGVLYVPGQYCYPGEGKPRRHDRIRLSFGVQSPAKIRLGIEALGRAIRRSA